MTTGVAAPGSKPSGIAAPETSTTYDVAGPIGAPAIVFIHGTRLTRAVWAAQTCRSYPRSRMHCLIKRMESS